MLLSDGLGLSAHESLLVFVCVRERDRRRQLWGTVLLFVLQLYCCMRNAGSVNSAVGGQVAACSIPFTADISRLLCFVPKHVCNSCLSGAVANRSIYQTHSIKYLTQ